MAAGLALSRAQVTTPDATYERVQVSVRANTARLVDGSGVVAEMGDVVGVRSLSRRVWELSFGDGTTWTVTRTAGCGCGR